MLSIDDPLTADERNRVLSAVWDQGQDIIAAQAGRIDNAADQEDFLQDVVLSILEHPPSVLAELGQDIRPWLTTVLRNRHRDAVRTHNRHERILREQAQTRLTGTHWLIPDPPADPETLWLQREAAQEVWHKVMALPPLLRDVAVLRAQGYTGPEICAELGITETAVRTRIWRFRKRS